VDGVVGYYMDGSGVQFVEGVKRFRIFAGVVDVYICRIGVGAGINKGNLGVGGYIARRGIIALRL